MIYKLILFNVSLPTGQTCLKSIDIVAYEQVIHPFKVYVSPFKLNRRNYPIQKNIVNANKNFKITLNLFQVINISTKMLLFKVVTKFLPVIRNR